MTDLVEQKKELNKSGIYDGIETLGVNETNMETKESNNKMKSFFDSEDANNESIIKDINLDSIDNEQKINKAEACQLRMSQAPPVPPIQISNVVNQRTQEQGRNIINLPKENYADIKLNFKGILNTDKYRLNSAKSKDTRSKYSESLPPSKLDVIVNISAIEIDKNDLEIHNEDTQKVLKVKKRISLKCLFHIISYIVLIGLITGLIIHISG